MQRGEEMDAKSIVNSQLALTYEAYNKSYEQRLNDKKLCLTVWLALLGFVATRPGVSLVQFAMLTNAPILLFWILDGMRAVYTQLWHSRIVHLERLLLTDSVSPADLRPLLFVSGSGLSFAGKIRALGFSLFLMESVFFFYLLVALVNLAFLCLYVKAT
jgi:hypothetical protein